MGIRPKFHILVGIDDAKRPDPRYKRPDADWLEEILWTRELTESEMWAGKGGKDEDGVYWSDWQDAERGIPGRSRLLSDMLYNPTFTNEYVNPTVVGLVLHEGPADDDILRALATIDPKFEVTGYARIPTLTRAEHSMQAQHYGVTDEDIANNMFVPSVFENMPAISRIQWTRAQFYLSLVGWTIPRNDLRYLLTWTWS